MKINLPLPILLYRMIIQLFWDFLAIAVPAGITLLEKIEQYSPKKKNKKESLK